MDAAEAIALLLPLTFYGAPIVLYAWLAPRYRAPSWLGCLMLPPVVNIFVLVWMLRCCERAPRHRLAARRG